MYDDSFRSMEAHITNVALNLLAHSTYYVCEFCGYKIARTVIALKLNLLQIDRFA